MLKNFRVILPVLTSVFCLALSTGCSTTKTPATANAFWIATANDQMIRSYTLDKSGSISAVGGGVAAGSQPSAIALSPDRITLFAANSGGNSVSVYSLDTNQSTLTSAGPPVAAGNTPAALAADPTYNLLFVAEKGSDTITVFAIGPGLLTLKTSFAIQTPAAAGGSGPVALAISPAGFSCIDSRTAVSVKQKCFALYAANQTSGTVTAYDYFVDSSGNFVRGTIDLNGNFIVGGTVAGSPYLAGTSPSAIAFSRCAGAGAAITSCQSAGVNGLLVANSGSNDISVFSACIQLPTCQLGESSPDGTLTALGGPIPVGATGPSILLVNPLADSVYAVDTGSNQITTLEFAPSTGTLTPLDATSPSTSQILSAAITTNVASNSQNWVVVTSVGTASVFSIGSKGSLTASGHGSISGHPSAILMQ